MSKLQAKYEEEMKLKRERKEKAEAELATMKSDHQRLIG